MRGAQAAGTAAEETVVPNNLLLQEMRTLPLNSNDPCANKAAITLCPALEARQLRYII
jgi:hypothetical protein